MILQSNTHFNNFQGDLRKGQIDLYFYIHIYVLPIVTLNNSLKLQARKGPLINKKYITSIFLYVAVFILEINNITK